MWHAMEMAPDGRSIVIPTPLGPLSLWHDRLQTGGIILRGTLW